MKLTREEVLTLADIDPELEQIFQKTPWKDHIHAETNIPRLRAALLNYQQSITSLVKRDEDPSYVEEDIQIPVRDGSLIAVRIYKPKNPPEDGCPIFVVYHGGGFCLGGLDDDAAFCRTFTKLGGIAVNVDYRLAPEHTFPVPFLDAYDALKWTAANFENLGGNSRKGFLVGGISAGANFSSILAHLARDDELKPPLTGVYLSNPPCGPPEVFPEKYRDVHLSREQNKNAPVLNQTSMTLFEKLYKAESMSRYRSPMFFESHKDLPPTYFQVCGMDPLRDDGLIYEHILREDYGIKTKLDVYPGLPHCFWSVWDDAEFSKRLRRESVKALEWLLEQSRS